MSSTYLNIDLENIQTDIFNVCIEFHKIYPNDNRPYIFLESIKRLLDNTQNLSDYEFYKLYSDYLDFPEWKIIYRKYLYNKER